LDDIAPTLNAGNGERICQRPKLSDPATGRFDCNRDALAGLEAHG